MRLDSKITLIILVIGSTNLFGQTQQENKKGGTPSNSYFSNFTPSGPGQASLGSFGNVPINFYTGLPEVSFNLMTLTSRDLSLPISISYDDSGLRLEEFSGPIGIKWNLSAGGFVARSVNGLPDDDPVKGYFVYRTDLNAASINGSTWTPFAEQNTRDTEPDEYVLNIGGRSIKFFLDNNQKGYSIPKQDVTITYTRDASQKIYQFVLTTEDGIKYTFGGTGVSVEERKIDNLNGSAYYYYDVKNDIYGYQNDSNFGFRVASSFYVGNDKMGSFSYSEKQGAFHNTKWHLVSIKSPSGDEITFNYTKQPNTQYTNRPNVTKRKPLLVHVPNYTYTGNYCTKSTFLTGCVNHQNLTFNHGAPTWPPPPNWVQMAPLAPYLTPSYATFSKTAANSETSAPAPIATQYLDPRTYPVVPDGYYYNQSFITESVITLTEINTAVGNKVVFAPPTNRPDMVNAKKYDRIQLKNMNGRVIKDFIFNYSVSGEGIVVDGQPLDENILGGAWLVEKWVGRDPLSFTILGKYVTEMQKSYNFKRLHLKSIQQVDLGGIAKPLYNFDYTTERVNRRTAYYQNAIGFASKQNFTIDQEQPHLNKRSDDGNMNQGKLKKISYATGGSTEFEYGLNSPNLPNQPNTWSNGQLTLMTDRDDNGGIVSQKSLQTLESYTAYQPLLTTIQYNIIPNSSFYSASIVESSYAQNRSFSFSHGVVYANKKVRVYDGLPNLHNGYQEFTFRTDSDLKTPVFASPADTDAQGNPVTSITTSNIFPFPKNKERDFLRGLLDEQTSFDRFGKKISYQKHYYKFNNVKLEDPYSEDSPAVGQHIPTTILGFTGGSFSHDNATNKKSRFGRYKVSADKVEKWKTEEKIYDQTDENKVFTKIDEFKYNAVNGLISNVITYNAATPTSKVETYTRYVVDDNYAGSAGASLSPDARAIIDLKLKHQSATPVEQGTIYTDGSTTTRGSTIVYKYKPLSSFNKPSQVLGLTKPPSNYRESIIDYYTGQFTVNAGFRVLHSYDAYDVNGNVLQQTSFDGIITKYVWGHNNSLVTKQIINPDEGAVPTGFKQETNYTHQPLIGVTNVLDPNNLSSSYYYDNSHRLMYSTRYDGKIVNRYRYHFKNEEDMLTASIQVTGPFLPGLQMTIQVPPVPNDRGSPSYSWNFGDGTTQTTGSNKIFHTFTSANRYNVSVAISHPEYGSAQASLPVTINPPITTSICVKGPITVKKTCSETIVTAQGSCGTSTSTSITLSNASGGCGEYTYQWQLQTISGSWVDLEEGTGTTLPVPYLFINRTVGTYNVRCMVTDKCGNAVSSVVTNLTVFRVCAQ